MKKVFSVSVDGKFKQHLMLSEHRFLREFCEQFGKVTFEIVSMTIQDYKFQFGKD